ncbi:MAG: oligosaccharide flippase family protein [Candidatus Dormiibacterota bacterium]
MTTVDTPPEIAHGRRVFRNTLISGIVGVLSLLINFFVVAFAIRRLGMSSYGVFVLALSFSVSAGYLSISDLGLQAGVSRFIADADGRGDRNRMGEVVSSALAILLCTGVGAAVVLLALAVAAAHLFHVPTESLRTALGLLFVIFAAEALFSLPGLAFYGLLQGLQRYGRIKAVDLTRQLFYTVTVVVVLGTGSGVVAFGAVTVASSLFAALGYALMARLSCPDLRISPRLISKAGLRPLAGFSGWAFVAAVNGVIWGQMDKVILAAVSPVSVLTGYDIANRLQSAASYPLSFTTQAVVPAAANLSAKASTIRLRALLIRGTRYTLALSFPATIAAMILARPLIVSWVGSQYSDISGPAQLFLIYQLVISSATIAHTILIGLGRIRTVALYATLAMVVNLGISIALVKPLGISGVIVGTLIGYGITAPLYIRLALQQLSMTFCEFFVHAILPIMIWAGVFAAVLLVTAWLIDPVQLVTVVACAVPAAMIYVIGIVRFAMTVEERRSLIGFLRPSRTS